MVDRGLDGLQRPWIVARTQSLEAAAAALDYVAPVGEKEAYVDNALKRVVPYLPA